MEDFGDFGDEFMLDSCLEDRLDVDLDLNYEDRFAQWDDDPSPYEGNYSEE